MHSSLPGSGHEVYQVRFALFQTVSAAALDLAEELVFGELLLGTVFPEFADAVELDSTSVSVAVLLDSGESLLSLLVITASELEGVAELDSGVLLELLELSSPQATDRSAQKAKGAIVPRYLRITVSFVLICYLFHPECPSP